MNELNKDTLQLAYEDATRIQPLLASWSDALDTKVVAVFSVASALLTFGPAFRNPTGTDAGKVLLIGAGVFWAVAAFFCRKAFNPRHMMIGPHPDVIQQPEWLGALPDEYRRARLTDMADAYAFNRGHLTGKADALRGAIAFTAIETLLLALALYFG